MPRIYSQDEVREIIRRAADATAERERQESESSGLTLTDLRDLAVSTGIDPDVMADAARSLDRDVDEPFEKRILGLKISAAHAVRLAGPFTDEDWQALVADCRRTFGAKGKLTDVSGLREWSNGNLHVLVEPAGDDVIIRMRTHKGQAETMLAGGIAMALAFTVMILSTFADGGAAQNLLPQVLLVFSLILGGGVFARKRIGDWSQTREAQMEAIGRRIEQRRDGRDEQTSAASERLTKADTDIRIELPDDEREEDVPSIRSRQREQ